MSRLEVAAAVAAATPRYGNMLISGQDGLSYGPEMQTCFHVLVTLRTQLRDINADV
jgi:hypothetical protein